MIETEYFHSSLVLQQAVTNTKNPRYLSVTIYLLSQSNAVGRTERINE